MKPIIEKKQAKVKELSELINSSKSFVLFEYQGINATDVTSLRKSLFATGAKLQVLKNNVINRALHDRSIKEFDQVLVGPNAMIFGLEDELSIFKLIVDVAKTHTFIKIKGGYFNGKYANPQEVEALAKIPSREGLYSMLLSCLTAPIRKVLYAFNAVADSKPH